VLIGNRAQLPRDGIHTLGRCLHLGLICVELSTGKLTAHRK
jgi:hypothetical protein